MLSRICIWVRRRAQGHCSMLSWTTDDLGWTVDLKRRASNSLENWQTSLNINSWSSGNLLRLFLHHHPLGSATLWVGTRSPCQRVIETVSKMRLKKATNFNNNQRTWDHKEESRSIAAASCVPDCRVFCITDPMRVPNRRRSIV